jgi:ABC-2 type transport system permease protein
LTDYPAYRGTRAPLRERLSHQSRILRVLAKTDFKLKYAGSVLGYVWSVTKPLLYFTVLWVVFRSIFQSTIHNFPVYLITGLVLWTFVADAVSGTLPSIVARGSILRRIAFPPIVIPVAATLTALMTCCINLIVVAIFIAVGRVEPNFKWFLLLPLFVELYLFVLGLSLIAATLYVRFRDIGQIWEVASSMLFFSAPILYPVTILPLWARHIIVFNPFVQILQDVRRIILGPDAHAVRLIGLHGNHVIPLAVTVVLLAAAFWLYRRDSPRFAELA